MGKVIDIFKKKQNLVLGLLIALFLMLVFVQTVSITDAHPDATVKDFSIMRPVSVPTQGDVRTALGIFEDEIGDVYSFDHLYNNVYALFVFGLVAVAMCLKKFNKGLLSKLVGLGFGACAIYSLFATNNLHYILSTYDSTYIFKVIVAVLIALISLVSVIMIIADLSKNGWLRDVNVHAFLNSICAILMLAGIACMFIPFEYQGKTASIMGYMLLPSNYAGGFDNAFDRLLDNMTLNSAMIIPILLFVVGIMGSIFCAGYHKNAVSPIMSIVWAVLVALGCFINPLVRLDSKLVVYIVIAVAIVVAAVINLFQLKKANEIYK